jgi:hypothetical protein
VVGTGISVVVTTVGATVGEGTAVGGIGISVGTSVVGTGVSLGAVVGGMGVGGTTVGGTAVGGSGCVGGGEVGGGTVAEGGSVGIRVGVRYGMAVAGGRRGTHNRCPALIRSDFRQLAFLSWGTLAPVD